MSDYGINYFKYSLPRLSNSGMDLGKSTKYLPIARIPTDTYR
jgi:hypothetical protein